MNIPQVEQALQFVDPYDRDTWLKVAMALKSEFGDSALGTFINWSSQASNFNLNDANAVWRSAKRNGGITIGTLKYEAKQNGWRPEVRYKRPSAEEIDMRLLQLRIEIKKEQETISKRQAKVALFAQKIWSEARVADANHPYLTRKMIKPLGLRQYFSRLIVPLFYNGQIVNLQYIESNGSKRFIKGGRVKGCYSPIGTLGDCFYICEGYATGASIHAITGGKGVLCALNAGNLLPVARQANMDYPHAKIIIGGDDDRFNCAKVGNTGRRYATKAALEIGAILLFPTFPPACDGVDFNDLHVFEQQRSTK